MKHHPIIGMVSNSAVGQASAKVVGQGGYNTAKAAAAEKEERNLQVLTRSATSNAEEQTEEDQIKEENLSYLMAKIDVAPALLKSIRAKEGLTFRMIRHGEDLGSIIDKGFLLDQGRAVSLYKNELKGIIEDLKNVICKCADAGFAHLDIKSQNIVVRKGPGGKMKVRLIDWEPKFMTNIEGDEDLWVALDKKPCEVLRCTYCIVMWGLFYLYLRKYGKRTDMKQKLMELAEKELRTCKINKKIKELLCQTCKLNPFLKDILLTQKNKDHLGQLGERIEGRLWNYFDGEIDTIDAFFKRLKLAETEDPGEAFGVRYDSPYTSAGETAPKRQVYGDFPQCLIEVDPPTPFTKVASNSWGEADRFKPLNNEKVEGESKIPWGRYQQITNADPDLRRQKKDAAYDTWLELKRKKNSHDRAKRRRI